MGKEGRHVQGSSQILTCCVLAPCSPSSGPPRVPGCCEKKAAHSEDERDSREGVEDAEKQQGSAARGGRQTLG